MTAITPRLMALIRARTQHDAHLRDMPEHQLLEFVSCAQVTNWILEEMWNLLADRAEARSGMPSAHHRRAE